MRLTHLAWVFALLMSIVFQAGAVSAQSGPTPTQPDTHTIQDKKSAQENKSPKPEHQRPSIWGEPTEVRVALYVIDVDGVDSANQRFSASVYIEARWSIPLLRHKGPAPLIRRTTDVWTPRLVIVNQQQAWSAFPPYVEILPDGEVIYRQKTWGWFSQPLELREFPADSQSLTVHLVAAGLLETEVKMVPLKTSTRTKSGIAEKFSMPDFSVTSWKAEAKPYVAVHGTVGIAGFALEIKIKRLISYYVWKVIFPLCLIIIMSWIPRWLDPTDGGTSLGISTTAFLTLVAYLFAIAVVLPRVSYLTHMDKFILMSTVLVFLGLMQTVLMTYLINFERAELAQRINIISRAVYPVLLLTVLVISFV